MMGRMVLVAAMVLGLTVGNWALVNAESRRPAPNRPEIVEVGEPILIERAVLAEEMERNVSLRDYIGLYGAPDYAEVQEIEIEEPFAPYEVRLYYLRGNRYLAFGRVNVAPSVYDYGVRKYIGAIDPEELARLLTAKPAGKVEAIAAVEVETTALVAEWPADDEGAVEVVEVELESVELLTPVEEPEVVAMLDQSVLDALQRMEAAADRAALAAGIAERASLAAVESADRTTMLLEEIIEAQEE